MTLPLKALALCFATISSFPTRGLDIMTLKPLREDYLESSLEADESMGYLLEKPPPPANKIASSEDIRRGRIESMARWKPNSNTYIWEYSGMIEGDIAVPDLKQSSAFLFMRLRTTWPGAVVPFYIDKIDFTNQQVEIIHRTMKYIESNSCVLFRPYNGTDEDFLWIRGERGAGCSSFVGRQDGGQEVNLSADLCTSQDTILHELMHALGFVHQHSARYRDRFVKILWDNIQTGMEGNFVKSPQSQNNDFHVGYDFNSIMHYSSYAFSANGFPTITPIVEETKHKTRNGLSKKDKIKLRKMYNCEY